MSLGCLKRPQPASLTPSSRLRNVRRSWNHPKGNERRGIVNRRWQMGRSGVGNRGVETDRRRWKRVLTSLVIQSGFCLDRKLHLSNARTNISTHWNWGKKYSIRVNNDYRSESLENYKKGYVKEFSFTSNWESSYFYEVCSIKPLKVSYTWLDVCDLVTLFHNT